MSLRRTFSSAAFERHPCTCRKLVWLCEQCSQETRAADTSYRRGWEWRTRYSTYLGGLGTRIGDGNEGVKCGRGQGCTAAREVEVEVDCQAEDLAAAFEQQGGSPDAVASRVDDSQETGYLRQEVVGIGGVVKKKLKRRVKVGAVVDEWEDERLCSTYLAREARGLERSWCGWCDRVIPGGRDRGS